MGTLRELDDASYTRLRKELLSKGSPVQREFIEQLADSRRFCAWFRERVPSTGDETVPLYPEPLTEHEYREPPPDTEESLHALWRELAPAVACKTTFWGEVTLAHIEGGLIESHYLASDAANGSEGIMRVHRVSARDDPKALDGCVRTALRRLSGLPERGNRSVYVDCPLSRAWWRTRLCGIVSTKTPAVKEQVQKVFRLSQEYWENLILLMVSRNSVLGDRNARDVLVWSLAERLQEDRESELFKTKSLRQLCRVLGIRAAWQEFGALDQGELKVVIDGEIRVRW